MITINNNTTTNVDFSYCVWILGTKQLKSHRIVRFPHQMGWDRGTADQSVSSHSPGCSSCHWPAPSFLCLPARTHHTETHKGKNHCSVIQGIPVQFPPVSVPGSLWYLHLNQWTLSKAPFLICAWKLSQWECWEPCPRVT